MIAARDSAFGGGIVAFENYIKRVNIVNCTVSTTNCKKGQWRGGNSEIANHYIPPLCEERSKQDYGIYLGANESTTVNDSFEL